MLRTTRDAVAGLTLPLDLPDVPRTRAAAADAVTQLDDYIIPRFASLHAPLLAVVGGSTGAGKSTLVNGIAGHPVTRAGAIRPTTRQPILLHHPSDEHWFTGRRVLGSLARVRGGQGDASNSLVLVGDPAIPAGIALLDAPDIDSVSDENRRLAGQLLSAADLWLFVTTANRYADAVPWDLLLDAAGRDITVAVVLDRVPAGVEDEVAADLRRMLTEQGLGESALFVVPETRLDEAAMLPAAAVAPIRGWLTEISRDAQSRAAISRRTLGGAVRALATRMDTLAEAQQDQRVAAARLADDVRGAYARAADLAMDSTRDGSLLRGEVLARWQDFVGTGEFFRSIETNLNRVRDRVGAFLRGEPAPVAQVENAIETGLHAVIVAQAARAAEASFDLWRSDAAGRSLTEGGDLSRLPAGFSDEVAQQIRQWQGDLLDLVSDQGAGKRRKARALSWGINGVAVALMVVVFASTAGLTGLEVGIAGGSAVVGQKALETLFGQDAVLELTALARTNLQERVAALFARDSRRFLDRLPDDGATAHAEDRAGVDRDRDADADADADAVTAPSMAELAVRLRRLADAA
ncbi:dynamin family protein [Tersicoccus sp. Bi-70]|uniref:dynamin family protein n=1 Tax=Tersicoccus sp. Bi-70 TaxID=1897634 RepID=UPI00097549CB|nr:ABC transporter [Tersicoccus sp. Bi-70]